MPLYAMIYTAYCILLLSNLLERTGEINEEQRTNETIIGNADDFRLCNPVLISKAEYLTYTQNENEN